MIYVNANLNLGSLTDIPFLVRTSALLNKIMLNVSAHIRSLFINNQKKKKTDITKRVNADNPQYDNPVGIAQTIIMTIL